MNVHQLVNVPIVQGPELDRIKNPLTQENLQHSWFDTYNDLLTQSANIIRVTLSLEDGDECDGTGPCLPLKSL